MSSEQTFIFNEPGLADRRLRQQRAYPRVDVDRAVLLQHKGISLRAVTKDVSPAGIFVRTQERLPVGSRVELSLDLTDERTPVELCGTVTRIAADEPGLAIQISEDGQRDACASIGAFVVDTLRGRAAESVTTDGADETVIEEHGDGAWLERHEFGRRKKSLDAKQHSLENSSAALSKVRDVVRAATQENERRGAELDDRARHLESVERRLTQQARSLQRQRVELDAREAALDELPAEVERLTDELDDCKRQLQVYTFERGELTRQLETMGKRRETLEEQLAEAEALQRSESPTEEITLTDSGSDDVPLNIPWQNSTPTAVRSVDGRIRWMRFQARMRHAFYWIADPFGRRR